MKQHGLMNYRFVKCIASCCVALLWGVTHAVACTSVIVSGKVTPDGRPYIFKNRDTGNTWPIAGSTLTTVAIPLWITPKNELPALVTRNGEGRAEPVIETLRKKGHAGRETAEFYQWVDQYVREQYQQRLGVVLISNNQK